MVYQAPGWAQEGTAPPGAVAGSWKPNPNALERFAQALALRYSGSFGGLPRVRLFEAWNEPNLSDYLAPQYKGREMVGAARYRRMLNAFYAGVKRVQSGATVIGGATGPFGDDPPDAWRTRPVRFLRDLLCLRAVGKRGAARRRICPNPPKFDILSHHPITLMFSPWRQPLSPNDVTVANFRRIGGLLRKAERGGTLGTRGRHPVWASEMWWESKPPDQSQFGMRISQLKRWVPGTMYELWKQGARAVIWLQIVDTPVGDNGFSGHQTGIYFSDGTKKPYYEGFQFPFVTQRRGRSAEVRAWMIPPASGPLSIQRKRKGGWGTIRRAQARRGKPLQATLRLPGTATLRATVAGQSSLGWRQNGR